MSDELQTIKDEFAHYSSYSSTPDEALALFDRARSVCPVPHSKELGGYHIFLSYEDVRKGLLDWRTFASGPSVMRPYVEGMPVFAPASVDPPEHSQWRKLFSDGLNLAVTERITAPVRESIHQFIDAFEGRGECDLFSELAEKVPMYAIFFVLGLDLKFYDDVVDLHNRLIGSVNDPKAFSAAFEEFAELGLAEIEKRHREPKDDYLTFLSQARMGDQPLTRQEIGTAIVGMLTGGHGTTVTAMACMFFEVIRNPFLKQRLIDNPALIPKAVEESLRLHHPFFGLYRRATKDVQVSGADILEGDSVLMCWQAANRDPAVFEDPNVFNLDRSENNHIAFGVGRHSCVGASMARMEMIETLDILLKRLPEIEISDPDSVKIEFAGGESIMLPKLLATFRAR